MTAMNESFAIFLAVWNRQQSQQTPRVHLRIANWLERRWLSGDKRLLLMAFRSCGKSTLVGLFCAWLFWRSPDLRILVLAADLALARKMVRNVKRIIERHPATQALKPARLDQWGSDKFTINRNKELRDPSMLAKGISANLTGTRADIIICDDVEVPKTCDTSDKRANLRERLLELDYILVPDGLQLYVGTPHSWYTIYAAAARAEAGEAQPFLNGFKRLVIPVLDQAGASVWPERFSLDVLDATKRKTGPRHFQSQMLCEPVNISEGRLNPQDLQIYEADLEYTEAARQPVLSLDGRKLVAASAWWDPAFGRADGDRSILAIVYGDEAGDYWLHHLAVIQVNTRDSTDAATQQCQQIAKLVERFYLPALTLETNGLGKFLPGLLRKALGEAGLMCAVNEVTSRRPKALRIIEAFDAVLAAQALHVHKDVLKTPFLQELQDWRPSGGANHDDTLDAVAGALSLQPVRLGRSYGSRAAKWHRGHSIETAKTIFEV